MDTIVIEGTRYLVMRKTDLDAIRTDSFREGMIRQYSLDHPTGSVDASGKVPNQCVMSNETVVVMVHSDDGYRLVFDMKFDGLDDPVKLVLIVNDARSVMDVLQEFIAYSEHGVVDE